MRGWTYVVAAGIDAAQLVVCDTCRLAYPRLDDEGQALYQPGEACEHCHAGELVDHNQAAAAPTPAQRLDQIRTRLAG